MTTSLTINESDLEKVDFIGHAPQLGSLEGTSVVNLVLLQVEAPVWEIVKMQILSLVSWRLMSFLI
jgi:hypothetical protein